MCVLRVLTYHAWPALHWCRRGAICGPRTSSGWRNEYRREHPALSCRLGLPHLGANGMRRRFVARPQDVAKRCCPGRVVSVLEGGYGEWKWERVPSNSNPKLRKLSVKVCVCVCGCLRWDLTLPTAHRCDAHWHVCDRNHRRAPCPERRRRLARVGSRCRWTTSRITAWHTCMASLETPQGADQLEVAQLLLASVCTAIACVVTLATLPSDSHIRRGRRVPLCQWVITHCHRQYGIGSELLSNTKLLSDYPTHTVAWCTRRVTRHGTYYRRHLATRTNACTHLPARPPCHAHARSAARGRSIIVPTRQRDRAAGSMTITSNTTKDKAITGHARNH